MTRPARAAFAAGLMLSVTSANATAQAPIATDRPSVAASSIVVPSGSLQIENGTTDTSSGGQHTFDGPETLLRLGLLPRTEVRVTLPNFVGQSGAGSDTGVADLTIGVKRQIVEGPGGAVSFMLSVSLPTGSDAISTHGYDPSVQVPWSRPLSSRVTAAGMFSLYAPTDGDRRNVTEEGAFLVDRQLTTQWSGFVEYVATFSAHSAAKHLVDSGTAFRITGEHQIDLRVGFGLSSAAADWLIGGGYSFRFTARRP